MSWLKLMRRKIIFLLALLINVGYIFCGVLDMYKDVILGIDGIPFYQVSEFYVHLAMSFLFLACCICGVSVYFKGQDGFVRILLLPFILIFRFFVPVKQDVGIVLAACVIIFAIVFVFGLFF